MKKLVMVGLVAGLLAGSLVAPAEAKKKKPKPAAPASVDLKFFLRQDSDACGESHEFLSLTDGTDLSCAYTGGGAMYEAYHQANTNSDGAVEENVPASPSGKVVWTTEDGVPFVLDGSKHITGEIVLHAWDLNGAKPAAGQATFDVSLAGEVDGEMKELGTVSETFTALPDGAQHTVKIDWTAPADLVGKTITSLTVTTIQRGGAVGPHVIELDAPAAYITVPALVTK